MVYQFAAIPVAAMWRRCKGLWQKLSGSSLGAASAIQRSGDDAARVAGALATGEEPSELRVLQGVVVAGDAHGGACARFAADEQGILAGEAANVALEEAQAFFHALAHARGQERREIPWGDAGVVACARQGGGDAAR